MVQDLIGGKVLNSGSVNTDPGHKVPFILGSVAGCTILHLPELHLSSEEAERMCCLLRPMQSTRWHLVSNKLAHSTVLSLCVLNYSKCLKYSRKDLNLPAFEASLFPEMLLVVLVKMRSCSMLQRPSQTGIFPHSSTHLSMGHLLLTFWLAPKILSVSQEGLLK